MRMRVLLAVVLLVSSGFVIDSQTIQLAVAQIEPLGVEPKTARMVEDLLQTELAKLPKFSLVERGRLEAVLKEQELQLSGITSAQSAARAGGVLNVEKVLFGSLARYDSEYIKYLLSLRMVDVQRATVEAAESVQIRSEEQLIAAVAEIAARIAAQVKVAGRVTAVEDTAVFVSLGEGAGTNPEDVLAVSAVEFFKDSSGRIMFSEEKGIANLVVEKVSAEGSRCRVLEAAAAVEVGQMVALGRTTLEQSKERCALEVRSVPAAANVFMDGKFLGITPLKLSDVEPGSYRIEIRSGAGYRPYQGKVSLRAGRSVSLERELEPEVEVQDILRFGKVPRKRTDPKTALRKALVPGLGAVYNGYDGQLPVIIFETAGLAGGSIQYALGEKGIVSVPALLFVGTALTNYGFSLVDAWTTASEDFLYPTYSELAIGAGAVTTQVPGGTEFGAGTSLELTYEGRRIFFQMGMQSALPFIVMTATTHS